MQEEKLVAVAVVVVVYRAVSIAQLGHFQCQLVTLKFEFNPASLSMSIKIPILKEIDAIEDEGDHM